ncbi:MAG: hypothetical protein ACYDHH_01465 [Solirubrobacteraceae bacterium]
MRRLQFAAIADRSTRRQLAGTAILATILLIGCGSATPPPGSSTIAPATPASLPPTSTTAATSGVHISASPNPVQGRPVKGITTIKWSMPAGSAATIRVSPNGGPAVLFAEGGAKGSAQAPFIVAGNSYKFELFSSPSASKPAAFVVVVRH